MGNNVMGVDLSLSNGDVRDLERARGLEWLVTNGRGGFAMASVPLLLSRRYHGLLVAAVEPPVERYVLLAKLDATVTIEGLTYELATNDYPEAVFPQGHKLLESFTADPFPTWRWRAGSALIEQTLCMAHGEDATFIRFRLVDGPESVNIAVRPLCTSRHFHTLSHYQDMGPPTVDEREDQLSFEWGAGRPGWRLSHNGSFRSRPDWYYRFVLAAECDRGYDFQQDLFMPGVVSATLRQGDASGLVFSATTGMGTWRDADAAFADAAARSEAVLAGAPLDPLAGALWRSSDDFVVARDGDFKTVIAGYPWFGDWGRDTFISLTGLCLVPGRFEEAKSIIETFSRYVDQGMIPNRFPDFGEPPAYDTADATLWYIHAIGRYLAYTGDFAFVRAKMLSVIGDILDAHERGTRHGIGLAKDGLLAAGESGYALTWMDAKLPDRAVTARIGKPVELSALWYNALLIAADIAERAGNTLRADYWRKLAERAKGAFNERFWNAHAGCLHDVVDPDHQIGAADSAVRPNQLMAISLTHPILDETRWRSVVDVCEKTLWTPLGMRTLSPDNPAYQPHYRGDMRARDEAYHQGTAWPWLLGPFVTAWCRAYGDGPRANAGAMRFLEGLIPHLRDAGLGSVSEVADGDPPHSPGGCPWQAWSVAEPLRALCEDILKSHPAEKKMPTGGPRLPQPMTGSPIGTH